MTPGQLVRAVSIALDVPEETVVQHDRNLVVAGLRTRGGRGRSAPEVTPVDAARLLVATLASIRTKDSAATVKQFERATFEPPDRPKDVWFGGSKLRLDGAPVQQFDPIIMSLPHTHNFIEGLAALIADASRPIEDLQSFLKRFANLGVSCSSPSGRATIGGVRFVSYAAPIRAPTNWTREEWQESQYYASGIHQERKAYGSALMLVGAAFRENGPRYANAYEAYLADYGIKDEKPNKPAKAGQRTGAL
jgi:hypothetical protein